MTVEGLKRKKEEETEKRVRLVLLIRLSQIIATVLMVIGFLYLMVILYLKYYS